MKRMSNVNFKKNYRIRETGWKLIGKIMLWESIIIVLSYFGVTALTRDFILVSGGLNLLGLFWLTLVWLSRFYIVSEEGVSKNTGVLWKRTATFDIGSIASVKVRQGIVGQILGYGSIILENPLTREDLVMKDVNNPYQQANLIEKQRLIEISKNPGKKVVPL